ncbi:hypothetical protein Bbelb_110670 [Branchiostoma belcheri]|nr:hypothetical protein Bbelb_110670 [Branchiostoma belcheri]
MENSGDYLIDISNQLAEINENLLEVIGTIKSITIFQLEIRANVEKLKNVTEDQDPKPDGDSSSTTCKFPKMENGGDYLIDISNQLAEISENLLEVMEAIKSITIFQLEIRANVEKLKNVTEDQDPKPDGDSSSTTCKFPKNERKTEDQDPKPDGDSSPTACKFPKLDASLSSTSK